MAGGEELGRLDAREFIRLRLLRCVSLPTLFPAVFPAVWASLCSLSQSRFLQYVTGAERIPLTGFRDLRGGGEVRLFKVTRVGAPSALPAAHACFNRVGLISTRRALTSSLTDASVALNSLPFAPQVDLPPYPSLAVLEQKLTMA